MARNERRTEYDVTDDINGKVLLKGTETTKFRLGSTSYEIDLIEANAKKLNTILDDFKPYQDATRQRQGAGAPTRRRGSSAPAGNKERLAAIRERSRGQGIEVAERGRIAQSVVDAFDAQ